MAEDGAFSKQFACFDVRGRERMGPVYRGAAGADPGSAKALENFALRV